MLRGIFGLWAVLATALVLLPLSSCRARTFEVLPIRSLMKARKPGTGGLHGRGYVARRRYRKAFSLLRAYLRAYLAEDATDEDRKKALSRIAALGKIGRQLLNLQIKAYSRKIEAMKEEEERADYVDWMLREMRADKRREMEAHLSALAKVYVSLPVEKPKVGPGASPPPGRYFISSAAPQHNRY